MLIQQKHRGVRFKVDRVKGKAPVAYKTYTQLADGSIHQKITRHLMGIMDSGISRIEIHLVAGNYQIVANYEKEVAFFKEYFPYIQVNFTSELK